MVEDYLSKKMKLDEFVTHNFPLSKVADAIGAMHEGNCIRAIISLNDQ